MATTYQLIASSTVGSGGASSITFSSIPATYTDLVVQISARSNRAADAADILVTFNSDGGNNYPYKQLYGFSGGAGSAGGTENQNFAGQMPANNSTSNTFGSSSIYIPNYAGTTFKSSSADTAWESNSDTLWQLNLFANLWNSTAAITSIALSASASSNFVQYSTATLYGIKNS